MTWQNSEGYQGEMVCGGENQARQGRDSGGTCVPYPMSHGSNCRFESEAGSRTVKPIIRRLLGVV